MTMTVTIRSRAKAKPLARERKPGEKGQRAGADGDEGQPERGAVRQILGPRFALLGLPDEFDDLGKIGVLPRPLDLHDDGPFRR